MQLLIQSLLGFMRHQKMNEGGGKRSHDICTIIVLFIFQLVWHAGAVLPEAEKTGSDILYLPIW